MAWLLLLSSFLYCFLLSFSESNLQLMSISSHLTTISDSIPCLCLSICVNPNTRTLTSFKVEPFWNFEKFSLNSTKFQNFKLSKFIHSTRYIYILTKKGDFLWLTQKLNDHTCGYSVSDSPFHYQVKEGRVQTRLKFIIFPSPLKRDILHTNLCGVCLHHKLQVSLLY